VTAGLRPPELPSCGRSRIMAYGKSGDAASRR